MAHECSCPRTGDTMSGRSNSGHPCRFSALEWTMLMRLMVSVDGRLFGVVIMHTRRAQKGYLVLAPCTAERPV